jgi:putative ABC transport system substrate-binding protein
MRESCKYGSVRGAGSNPRPYRNRRTFIVGLGSAAAWPVVARAQQPAMPVVGWLSSRNSETDGYVLPAFRQGLNRQGYVEGQNVTIEYRWSDTQDDRLPALAADLVRRQVAVFAVAGTSLAVRAIQAITTTIPIVSLTGFSDITRRPGGNITGSYGIFAALGGKRIGLLHDLLPRATTIAVLATNFVGPTDVQEAARALGLQIKFLIASTDGELDAALASLAQMRPDALMVGAGAGPLFFTRADKIVAAARQLAIPAMYFRREFVLAGGLMSYGTNADETFQVMGEYTGRVLKGEKPGDLPIQQPTKFQLVINLKTAKRLGLTIPETLLATADEVIQ